MANRDIFERAHRGDYETIKNKVEEDNNVLKKRDANDRVLLHWAALSGNVKLVEYLVESGSAVDPTDDTDTTPLILASSAGRTDVVEFLIKHGAYVNHTTTQGHSALQYACSKDFLDIAVILLENDADINITDIRRATSLHRAASKGNIAILKLLLSHKESLKINAVDYYGNTPLHLACEEYRQEEAKLLVQNGANISMVNKEKNTPLDLCSPSLAMVLANLKVSEEML